MASRRGEGFFDRLLHVAVEPDAERQVARERAQRARMPETFLAFPNLIRAARERDEPRVLKLERTLHWPREFVPLVAVLCAWAEEHQTPRAIDKVALLGETGLDQLEKIWPDLADSI